MNKSFYPKKSLGQHFLHDQIVLQKIIDLISPNFSDNIVEIGPGRGALTALLLPLVDQINVIELDKDAIIELKINCKNSTKLIVHEADILDFDLTSLKQSIRLIGNLPYNISTPILFKAIKNIRIIKDMHFMLQKEVAERIISPPGTKTYGRLSVMVQYYCNPTMLLGVKPASFFPSPKVHSAFIRLIPRKNYSPTALNEELFSEVVKSAFTHRRKIIANSLKKYLAEAQLKKIGINPNNRPEQLQVNDFVLISNIICKNSI